MKTSQLLFGKKECSSPASLWSRILRRAFHSLYLLFNWACVIVFAYQGYRWIREGGWTKIPTRLALPKGVLASPLFAESHGVGRLLQWCCTVDLAYTLCAVAMACYGAAWLLERNGRQRQCRFPALSGRATSWCE